MLFLYEIVIHVGNSFNMILENSQKVPKSTGVSASILKHFSFSKKDIPLLIKNKKRICL